MNPPTALSKVNARRMMIYIGKKLREIYRNQIAGNHSVEWLHENIEKELFWVNESGGIWNFDMVVDLRFAIVAVQPSQGSDWIYIELKVE